MNGKKALRIIFGCLCLLGLDFASKAYVYHHIPPMAWASSVYPYGGIAVFHNWHGIDFSINYVMNKGAAWGVFSSFQDHLLYIRLVIIGGLLTYLVVGKASLFKKVALALVATGAIGNIIDYFVYGHVVDMFYFVFWSYSYPVFNVADSAIFSGICLLFLDALLNKLRSIKFFKSKEPKAAQ